MFCPLGRPYASKWFEDDLYGVFGVKMRVRAQIIKTYIFIWMVVCLVVGFIVGFFLGVVI